MRAWMIAAAVAGLAVGPADAADLPEPTPTARDMYISCYLLAHETDVPSRPNGKPETFSMTWCGARGLAEIAGHEGKAVESKYKFCLDDRAATQTDTLKAMAYAYLDFYENNANLNRGADGRAAFLFAMVARWPCSA